MKQKRSLLKPQLFQAQHGDQADNGRSSLGDDGGGGGSGHVPPEDHDEQQIQGDIHARGDEHGQQRRPGIAQGPQQRGKEVVGSGDENAAIENGKIGFRLAKHHLLGADEPQQGAGEDQPQDGKAHGQNGGEHQQRGNAPAQSPEISRAKALGHGNGKALHDPRNQPEHQPAEPVGGAHRSQGLHAGELPHDDGVGHGVKLLEDVAHHQRQGEQYDELGGIAPGHVFYRRTHGETSFFDWNSFSRARSRWK